MRIAMFMPSLGPTALGWNVHLDLAAEIERRGHRFTLLTTPPPASRAAASGDSGAVATVLDEPASWQRFAEPLRPLLRTRNLLPAAGALVPWLRAHGDEVDLLHLEVAYPHGTAGTIAASRSGWRGPVAMTPMGEDILVVRERSYGMRRYPVPAALVRWALGRAAAVRCISPIAERQVAELAPRAPRQMIPLNISAEAAAALDRSPAERDAFRAASRRRIDDEFGTGARPLVLSFGRLHPFKGIDYLVEAATRIGDADVLVVGPSLCVRPVGDVATALRAQAAELGVADKVQVVGAVEPARALEVLAAADAVVVPSPLESLNKVCMEAAAVGTPFVVTETTGIAHWVPDEGVGLIVPPRNPAALAWAIDEIIGGEFVFDADAAALFAGRFTPAEIAGELIELYERIV